MHFDVNELLPAVEAVELLGFAVARGGDLELTDEGKAFAEATVQEKKEIFRRALLKCIAPAREIVVQLQEREDHRMPADTYLDVLERHFSFEESRRQLDILIGWGRYAEAYSYDELTGDLFTEPVGDQAASAPA